ncbi:protein O-mannosyl-transferase 2-like [Pollicipes pollicipes]|uniref:protein O-mannosyl-transferase 2-like n=1 Tax=Pollicipes pollicipes TaxID=41117 RepID=UPI001884F01B|nr:protein O-mannosyl-transferase 2-like [Pollicipes pollicipes]
MIVAAIGYMADQNVSMPIDNDRPYEYPQDQWHILMRMGVSLFGVFQVVTSFLLVWEISRSLSAAYITTLLIVCDSAAHAYNRLILLDPILVWFILQSAYSSVKFWSCRDRPFGVRWWLWLLQTGVCLGLTFAVKYVGAFVVVLVGLQAVYDLWQQYCDTSAGLMNLIKHFLARCVGLVLVPILLYLSTFVLHLHLLHKGANSPGIGFHSAQFRLSFPDHNISRHTPSVVMYGSQVTLLSAVRPSGYLTTSYDLYPPEYGAEHQVIALDMNLDELNAWGFKRVDEGRLADMTSDEYVAQPVAHGDLVRLLNVFTERHLHTHRVRAPITRHMYMATGFGEVDEFYEGSVWRVLLDEPGAEPGVTPLRAVGSWFRLINNRTGCALRPGLSKYPSWGFGAWEAACDPKGVNLKDVHQLWQIDENVNPKVEGTDLKALYEMSTLNKIVELHQVMLNSNSKLKVYDFEGEDGMQKLLRSHPWMWPVLYRGCPGHGTTWHSLYFVGSPHVYFLNLAVLCLLPLLWVVSEVRRQRRPRQPAECSRIREGLLYLLLGWALHYLPFWAMQRILYFHHYLPSFFFSTMISGVVVDGLIGGLERLPLPLGRQFVRPTILAAISAFYVNSFLTNWELAFGVPGDGTSELLVKRFLYFDSWEM